MRVETMRYTERFGSVRINDLQGVIELDSGRIENMPPKEAIGVKKIEDEAIRDIERRMAIVIPTKDEKLKLFEGVISGIPHDCLIIVVSNSQINRVDRFRMEGDTLAQFCHFSQREALILHQKDPLLAETLGEAGYTDLLGDDGANNGWQNWLKKTTLVLLMPITTFLGQCGNTLNATQLASVWLPRLTGYGENLVAL